MSVKRGIDADVHVCGVRVLIQRTGPGAPMASDPGIQAESRDAAARTR